MGVVVWLGMQVLNGFASSFGGDLLRLIVLVPLGAAVFAGGVWMLRLQGREELVAMLKRRSPRPSPN